MPDQQSPERRRHALAVNAMGSAINAGSHWLPLTARIAAVDAVLAALDTEPAVNRAAVYREAADALDNSDWLRDYTDDHMRDVNEAAGELRRLADGMEGKSCRDL